MKKIIYSLLFFLSLEFGIWNLEFGISASSQNNKFYGNIDLLSTAPNNKITWGDSANHYIYRLPYYGVTMVGNFRIPVTTPTSGIIYKGTRRFITTYTNNNSNIFIGLDAGNFSTINNGGDIGIGEQALRYSNYGTPHLGNTVFGNIAIGYRALNNLTTGYNDIAIGFSCATAQTTGTGNTFIGNNIINSNNYNNSIMLIEGRYYTTSGLNDTKASNSIQLGSDSMTALYCTAMYTGTTTAAPNLVVASNGSIARSTTAPGTNLWAAYSNNIANTNTGNIGLGVTNPTLNLAFSGNGPRTFGLERITDNTKPGSSLTINAGPSGANGLNISGGSLLLQAGTSTGTGVSVIGFYTSGTGLAVTNNTTDQALTQKMQITGPGGLIYTPVNTGNIGPSTGITSDMLAYDIRYTGGSAIKLGSGTQIAAGTDGQVIEITSMSTDANYLEFITGKGLVLSTSSFQMGQNDVISFRFTGTCWVERFRSNNNNTCTAP